MTTPGVPMVFAGDEIGLEGEWGEDARRTMPWARPATWDTDAARRATGELDRAAPGQSRALARGGIRYAHVSADAIAYLREAPGERRALPRDARRRTSRSGCRSRRSAATELETLVGEDVADRTATTSLLPAGGPAFHAWRVA